MDMNTKFAYLRDTRNKKRILTIARRVDPENGETSIGFAVCSPKDNFNKKKGREIAEGRMREAPLFHDDPQGLLLMLSHLVFDGAPLQFNQEICPYIVWEPRVRGDFTNTAPPIMFTLSKFDRCNTVAEFIHKRHCTPDVWLGIWNNGRIQKTVGNQKLANQAKRLCGPSTV
jgi:hypothetical protein